MTLSAQPSKSDSESTGEELEESSPVAEEEQRGWCLLTICLQGKPHHLSQYSHQGSIIQGMVGDWIQKIHFVSRGTLLLQKKSVPDARPSKCLVSVEGSSLGRKLVLK